METEDRNFYAGICFRDVADEDYMSARLLYLYHLYDQSFVSMQQSLEKYLKAVLLYNGIKTPTKNKPTHDLSKLLAACGNLVIKDETNTMILKLNHIEDIRYRLLSHGVNQSEKALESFDFAVCDLRRYCKPDSLKAQKDFSELEINNFVNGRQLFGGKLEKIILQTEPSKSDSMLKHFAWTQRMMLTRQNKLFDINVHVNEIGFGKNSPFDASNKPISLFNAIKEYVYLSPDVRISFIAIAKLLEKAQQEGGITLRFNMSTRERVEEVRGDYWYYPVFPDQTSICGIDDLEATFTVFRLNNLYILTQPNRYLGIWLNSADNMYYLDINERSKTEAGAKNRADQINAKTKRKIIAIYNPATNKTVRLINKS